MLIPSLLTGAQPKIVISGTGRAGTTFLVQLFTELGEDTGYTRENWRRSYDEHCAAGLEHDITAENAPRIVKNPALCDTLPDLLARGAVTVEHAIVPMRVLEEAARSRIRVGGRGGTPGGLWGTRRTEEQQAVLAEKFHRLVHALVTHQVPVTFLAFPRFVCDGEYAWEQMRVVLPNVRREDFLAAFRRVARPELVHDFAAGVPADAGQPARDYVARKRQRRLERWRRRIGAWLSLRRFRAAAEKT